MVHGNLYEQVNYYNSTMKPNENVLKFQFSLVPGFEAVYKGGAEQVLLNATDESDARSEHVGAILLVEPFSC